MSKEYSEKNPTYFDNSRLDVLEFIPSSTKIILDVGMGYGNFLKEVKNKFSCETWGIELEEKAYNQAVSKVDKAFFGTVEDNLSNLPDKYFDCITFNDFLERFDRPLAS